MELRHNLMMAYGHLIEDLDALGLSQFYRADLAAVVGRDRVDRVLDARYAPPAPRRRRLRRLRRRWVAAGASGLLVLAALIGFCAGDMRVTSHALKIGMTSPLWVAVYRSAAIPEGLKISMRAEALGSLDTLPVGSELWWSLRADSRVPVAVRRRMEADLKARELAERGLPPDGNDGEAASVSDRDVAGSPPSPREEARPGPPGPNGPL